jgi:hypothetical protein
MFAAWAVTEKLHRPAFKRCVRPLHNCRHFFSHKQLDIVEWGVAMRKTVENGIPDTAPYKEWLGIVGTMAVAVLICAVLFASSIPT